MALLGSTTLRRPIPHEPGEWIDLRMLGWRALEEARQTRSIQALKTAVSAGAEALEIADRLGARQVNEPEKEPEQPDPVLQYDLGTLLVQGIAGWSYEQPVTPEWIERLDPKTADWIAHELIADLREPEGKGSNGLLLSTTTSTELDPLPTNG